jgi:hypothetical protein
MVLCMTTWGREQFTRGAMALLVEQLRRRGTIKLALPAHPPKSDLDKIAKRFGLASPDGMAAEIVKDMISTSGLGMYIKFLQNASMLAAKQKKALSWDHFVAAYEIIRKLGDGKE